MGNFTVLRKNVINAKGQLGADWFNNLTHTIQILKTHWSLKSIHPVPNMSWNYVAFATQNKNPVILKISCDHDSIFTEYQALQHFKGIGAIKIMDYCSEYHAMLLQSAIPGSLLKDEPFEKIENIINYYASVAKKLISEQRPVHAFPHIKEWCRVIDEIKDPRVPKKYITKAKQSRAWLCESMRHEYVCHGDLHLENIIKNGEQWLAIDPKGLIGELAFEVSAFDLLNENERCLVNATEIMNDRIQRLAAVLNLNIERLTAWIFLRIMLSIQWFIEDNGDPTPMLIAAKNIFSSVKIPQSW